VEVSSTSKRQKPHVSIEDKAQIDSPVLPPRWEATSELRWRPGAGQHIIFVTRWSAAPGDGEPTIQQEEIGGQEKAQEAGHAMELLPSLEMLRIVAARWAAITGEDESERPALVALRVPGALGPAELARWCPGAMARLYTLGGPVPPLPDTALGEPPLAGYSVVRAPNMSFWPQLRAMIEEQERVSPGMELWEDLEHDLALLEQELAWWIASPQGFVLNLYEGEELIGHLSLARQLDEVEGCNGWGIIALHIARRARGQRLGTLLQRVAATLIVTRRFTRRLLLAEKETAAETNQDNEAQQRDTDQTDAVQSASQGDEARSHADQTDAAQDAGPSGYAPAPNTQNWPYLFGFVAAQNTPALRGAYEAGRRIIATYVDVPIEALAREE
jgi:hypothetical protein